MSSSSESRATPGVVCGWVERASWSAERWTTVTQHADFSRLVRGVFGLRSQDGTHDGSGARDGAPGMASELENELAEAFQQYLARVPRGVHRQDAQRRVMLSDGDAAVGIVAAAARVDNLLTKLKKNKHVADTSKSGAKMPSARGNAAGAEASAGSGGVASVAAARPPKRRPQFNFVGAGASARSGSSSRPRPVETCIIIPKKEEGGAAKNTAAAKPRFKFVGADGKPSKTITLHGFECVCCSPEGDVVVMNPTLGKLMGQRSKAGEFDEDAASARWDAPAHTLLPGVRLTLNPCWYPRHFARPRGAHALLLTLGVWRVAGVVTWMVLGERWRCPHSKGSRHHPSLPPVDTPTMRTTMPASPL